MQNMSGARQIAADRVSRLPWLAPPAGYVVLIQDVAYGNRYKIARHQQMDRHQITRGAVFPFETRVALILEADDAAQAERELHNELAPASVIGDWFDLDQFPKTPTVQSAPTAPSIPQESVSLRELVENDEGADSLLQAAKIIGARAEPSIPHTSERNERRRARRRRRPRALRWVFAFGVFVLIGFLVAEFGGGIGGFAESLLVEWRQQASPPTPTVQGKGEVFYTKARAAHLRTCAAASCRSVGVLFPGAKVVASKFVKGQRVDGSARWIALEYKGELRYLHDSVLTRTWPHDEPTPAPSPTAKPTRVKATAAGQGEVFYTSARARVRACANVSCGTVQVLRAGAKITARRYVTGQQVKGSDRWIAILLKGELRYIHDSLLSRTWPLDQETPAPSPTAKPTRVKATAVGQGEVFYTRTRARVRACANVSCGSVQVLPAGTKITARRYVSGQQVKGSDRWIAALFEGELRYIHDSLLSRTWPLEEPTPEPSPTAKPTRVKATAVGQGEVFYVRSRAVARHCARLSCEVLEEIPAGTKITAIRFVAGEMVGASELWIRFSYKGRHLSIHSGSLTRSMPEAVTSSTEQAPDSATYTVIAGAIFYTMQPASVRECAHESCKADAILPKGTRITLTGYSMGQTIDGDDRWASIIYEGRRRFVPFSALSNSPPPLAPLLEPSSTQLPSADQSAIYVKDRNYYVRSRVRASIRNCASPNCDEVGVLLPGMHVWAVAVVHGRPVAGNNIWIQFGYRGQRRYVHTGFLLPVHDRADTNTGASPAAHSTAAVAQPSPTAMPAGIEPSAAAADEALYVMTESYLRRCARLSCEIIEILPPGSKITVVKAVRGEWIDGSDRWIETTRNSRYVYVHSGSLTSVPLEAEATPQPTADGGGEVFYVRTQTPARTCPHLDCERGLSLSTGMRVIALRYVNSQPVAGDRRWIRFMYGGWIQYVHISALSSDKPKADPTLQPALTETATSTMTESPPTATTTTTDAPRVRFVVETVGNQNAHIRACPSTDCDIVAKYSPGTEVDVLGPIQGETVYESDIWLEIGFEGGSAFIHSELVAEAD